MSSQFSAFDLSIVPVRLAAIGLETFAAIGDQVKPSKNIRKDT